MFNLYANILLLLISFSPYLERKGHFAAAEIETHRQSGKLYDVIKFYDSRGYQSHDVYWISPGSVISTNSNGQFYFSSQSGNSSVRYTFDKLIIDKKEVEIP